MGKICENKDFFSPCHNLTKTSLSLKKQEMKNNKNKIMYQNWIKKTQGSEKV